MSRTQIHDLWFQYIKKTILKSNNNRNTRNFIWGMNSSTYNIERRYKVKNIYNKFYLVSIHQRLILNQASCNLLVRPTSGFISNFCISWKSFNTFEDYVEEYWSPFQPRKKANYKLIIIWQNNERVKMEQVDKYRNP